MLMQLRSQLVSGKVIGKKIFNAVESCVTCLRKTFNKWMLGKSIDKFAANFAIILFPYKSRVSSNSVTLLMSGPIAILVTRSVIISTTTGT